MKRLARQLCDEAEQLGFVHERTNSKGWLVYIDPAGHEVHISPDPAEHQARSIRRAMRQAAGVYEAPAGRCAQAVKDRAARRRELDGERLAAERHEVQRRHDEFLARIENAPHLRHDPTSLRRVEGYLRELDRLDALMRAIPAGGDHQGRRGARHTTGRREPQPT